MAGQIDHYLSLEFRSFEIGASCFQDGTSVVPDGLAATVDFEADKLQFLRGHVGKEIKILMDGHIGNTPGKVWDLATALIVARSLEPFDLFLLEEPLHYTNPWGYSELCKATSIPIAGGECLTPIYIWRVYVERDCFDIGQPDAAFSGVLGSS